MYIKNKKNRSSKKISKTTWNCIVCFEYICYCLISINRGDCPHFPTNFDFTKILPLVEYRIWQLIKILYKRPFAKNLSVVSQSIFGLFQIKGILALGVTGRLWILALGVTGCVEMPHMLVQNKCLMTFIVVI